MCRWHTPTGVRATIALRHGKAKVVLCRAAQQRSSANSDRQQNEWTLVRSTRFRLDFHLVRHVYEATLSAIGWRHRWNHQLHFTTPVRVRADTECTLLLDGFHLIFDFGGRYLAVVGNSFAQRETRVVDGDIALVVDLCGDDDALAGNESGLWQTGDNGQRTGATGPAAEGLQVLHLDGGLDGDGATGKHTNICNDLYSYSNP